MPGLIRRDRVLYVDGDPPPAPEHPAWKRLKGELRIRRHGVVQIEFHDGIPLTLVTVQDDQKQKLA